MPFRYLEVQELEQKDYATRKTFARLIVNRLNENPDFCNKIMFSDEAHYDLLQ